VTPKSTAGGILPAHGPPRTGRAADAGPADGGPPDDAGIGRLTALDVRILEGVAVGTSTVRLAASLSEPTGSQIPHTA
jgi:hypothetical protein